MQDKFAFVVGGTSRFTATRLAIDDAGGRVGYVDKTAQVTLHDLRVRDVPAPPLGHALRVLDDARVIIERAVFERILGQAIQAEANAVVTLNDARFDDVLMAVHATAQARIDGARIHVAHAHRVGVCLNIGAGAVLEHVMVRDGASAEGGSAIAVTDQATLTLEDFDLAHHVDAGLHAGSNAFLLDRGRIRDGTFGIAAPERPPWRQLPGVRVERNRERFVVR